MLEIRALESVSSIATAERVVGKKRLKRVMGVAVRFPRTDRAAETMATPRMPRAICTVLLQRITRREDETQLIEQSPIEEEEVAAEPQPVME